jgi:hypothetical protein
MNFFKKKLPDCDTLFQKFMSPCYPENERPTMTRPDMFIIERPSEESFSFETFQYLPDDILRDTIDLLRKLANAALEDYQHIIPSNNLNLNVVDAVDKHFDRVRISALIKQSDPKDHMNEYLGSVCEFGAMLGYLFNQEKGFEWLCSDPYFDSVIIHPGSGYVITVFDWAVKKFSEYGVDDGFVAKYHMAVATIKKEFG